MNKKDSITTFNKEVSAWYDSPVGRAVQVDLQNYIAARIQNTFGYYAVELGIQHSQSLLQHTRINYHFRFAAQHEASLVDCVSSLKALPIECSSVDLVVANHVLDLSHDPHQALREIDRILMPDGECILIGFNPMSVAGLRHLLRRRRYEITLDTFYTQKRVKDWFSVLGFSIKDEQRMGYQCFGAGKFIQRNTAFLERLGQRWGLPLSRIYVLHLKKTMVTLTPTRSFQRPSILTPVTGMASNVHTKKPSPAQREQIEHEPSPENR